MSGPEPIRVPPGSVQCPCCGEHQNIMFAEQQHALILWNPRLEGYEGVPLSPELYHMLKNEWALAVSGAPPEAP